jgi:hypothetical protein
MVSFRLLALPPIPTQFHLPLPHASSATGGGTVTATYQINVGVAVYGFATGWGAGLWGGFVSGTTQTTLSLALSAANTTITVASTTGFSNATGTLLIDQELATYCWKYFHHIYRRYSRSQWHNSHISYVGYYGI